MLFPGRSIFPLLPPYGAHDPGRSVPVHPDSITPYLGLRSRLSQIWMNRWTILLLLVLARVLIAVTGLETNMDSAKREALSACTSVESMGSTMASMPHYLSEGVNDLTASGVEGAVHALRKMLELTVTGVEEMVIFVLKLLYQTYFCLGLLVVRGTVGVGLDLIKEVTDYLDDAIKSAGDDLADMASSFTDKLNGFLDLINPVTSLISGEEETPKLDVSGLVTTLRDAHLPTGIEKGLDKINSSIPTFDEASNYTESLIRKPFEEIKRLMNDSMGSWTFDRSTLPVPAKKQMSFCQDDDGINSFFNSVSDIAETARKIFIAVLIVAAVLVCIPTAWQEIRRWRSMKERSQLVTKDAHDPMDVVYIVSRPISATVGIKAASRFSNSRRQILVRWIIAYATSPPALFVLFLALVGFFGCLCQYALIKAVNKAVPDLSAHVGEFADKIVNSLQDTSAEWSDSTNGVISNMNKDLNEDIFGWVNTSTTSINDTLNAFVDSTTNVLNETWGDTLLYEPLMDVFECLIGLKIQGIQRGLTWVHDNAHINFPLLPNDTLSKGAAASLSDEDASNSFLADAGDSTSDKITEVVYRVTNAFESGIRTEALISLAILMVYFANVLIGVIRALSLFWKREKNRGEGGAAPAPSVNPHDPDGSGFTNVPLTAIPQNQSFPRSEPTPQYEPPSTNRSVPGLAVSSRDLYFEDEKLGFAGHRNALKVSGVSHLRGSSYVEYGGEKR